MSVNFQFVCRPLTLSGDLYLFQIIKAMKEIKLFWEGLWDITEQDAPLNIPDSGGILMLIDACYTPNKIGFDTDSYRLIELRETNNMYSAILNGNYFQAWKNRCENRLLLKIAKIENQTERQEVLRLLVGADRENCSDIILTNAGYKLPLKGHYANNLKESAA
jgi:hypothetical protein